MGKALSNKILFLAGVHGDEKIGIEILRKLEKENSTQKFPWFIANEKAVKRGVRFIDVDLNRIAPGNRTSKQYEPRRAYEIIKIANNYRYVIDVHGTISKSGIFIIISTLKPENLILAVSLPIKNVVIWKFKDSKRGPIIHFVNCGVGIECGPKNSKKIQKQLLKILRYVVQGKIIFSKKLLKSKNYFQVYGKLLKRETPRAVSKKLRDFKKTTLKGETFYPLLVGQYQRQGIICYKMEKVNFCDILPYLK